MQAEERRGISSSGFLVLFQFCLKKKKKKRKEKRKYCQMTLHRINFSEQENNTVKSACRIDSLGVIHMIGD